MQTYEFTRYVQRSKGPNWVTVQTDKGLAEAYRIAAARLNTTTDCIRQVKFGA